MGRPLSFKVWDKKNNKFVCDIGEEFISLNGKFYDVKLGYEKDMEIMQYTGLKDFEGKDIYEGDILEIRVRKSQIEEFSFLNLPNSYIMIVGFSDGSFGIKENNKKPGNEICSFQKFTSSFKERIKIIGNIYENPELLEVEE